MTDTKLLERVRAALKATDQILLVEDLEGDQAESFSFTEGRLYELMTLLTQYTDNGIPLPAFVTRQVEHALEESGEDTLLAIAKEY